jgi:hypothetical protein
MWYFYTISIKMDKVKLRGSYGVYWVWDSFLLKYGGEFFLKGEVFSV